MKNLPGITLMLLAYLPSVAQMGDCPGLRKALQEIVKPAFVPVVICDSSLEAHGRYRNDTIWLGSASRDFPTPEDRLSLLYHEYQHHRYAESGQFPVCLDASGLPVQWMTDSMVAYKPGYQQVCRDWEATLEQWPAADSAQRRQLWRDLSKARKQVFRYAPSNLAREEIAAYTAQIKAHQEGVLPLSAAALRAVRIRLHQLKHSLEWRLLWEDAHHLKPDGSKNGSKK